MVESLVDCHYPPAVGRLRRQSGNPGDILESFRIRKKGHPIHLEHAKRTRIVASNRDSGDPIPEIQRLLVNRADAKGMLLVKTLKRQRLDKLRTKTDISHRRLSRLGLLLYETLTGLYQAFRDCGHPWVLLDLKLAHQQV